MDNTTANSTIPHIDSFSPFISENHFKNMKMEDDIEIDIGEGPDVPMLPSTGISIEKDTYEAEEDDDDMDLNTPFHYQNQLLHEWQHMSQ